MVAATQEWRSVLRRHSGRPALWHAYLVFRRTDFSSYTTQRMRHLHDDALDVINRLSLLATQNCYINALDVISPFLCFPPRTAASDTTLKHIVDALAADLGAIILQQLTVRLL